MFEGMPQWGSPPPPPPPPQRGASSFSLPLSAPPWEPHLTSRRGFTTSPSATRSASSPLRLRLQAAAPHKYSSVSLPFYHSVSGYIVCKAAVMFDSFNGVDKWAIVGGGGWWCSWDIRFNKSENPSSSIECIGYRERKAFVKGQILLINHALLNTMKQPFSSKSLSCHRTVSLRSYIQHWKLSEIRRLAGFELRISNTDAILNNVKQSFISKNLSCRRVLYLIF